MNDDDADCDAIDTTDSGDAIETEYDSGSGATDSDDDDDDDGVTSYQPLHCTVNVVFNSMPTDGDSVHVPGCGGEFTVITVDAVAVNTIFAGGDGDISNAVTVTIY